MYHELLADLRCIQLAYVFKPKHFDRDTIKTQLQHIVSEIHPLRVSLGLWASQDEYKNCMAKIYRIVRDTIKVIKALKERDSLRLATQEENHAMVVKRTHPKYKPAAQPWDQFLTFGAPSLPVAHFLAPYPFPVPVDVRYPHMRQIKSTAVQALPQATSGVLARWTLGFKTAIDYYHNVRIGYPYYRLGHDLYILMTSSFIHKTQISEA